MCAIEHLDIPLAGTRFAQMPEVKSLDLLADRIRNVGSDPVTGSANIGRAYPDMAGNLPLAKSALCGKG